MTGPRLSEAAVRGRLTLADIADLPTITVPQAAQVLNIGRDAGYAAAASGQIPVLRLGRSLRVPVPRLLELLGVVPTTDEAPPAVTGERFTIVKSAAASDFNPSGDHHSDPPPAA